MNRIETFMNKLTPFFWGVGITCFISVVAFMFIHRIGLMNFINDPAYFDNLPKMERVYQLKK